MSSVQEVIEKFSAAKKVAESVFPKVSPALVMNLYLDQQANNKRIYTMEIILARGLDTEELRERVIDATGMVPAFYLEGTKMIVSHTIDMDFLKRINDLDFVVKIKGSPYSASGSTDF